MNALSVRGLKKVYPSFTLNEVSFEVGEGRIVGLIGRNGAGKSTAIKSILRLITSEGSVEVFGRKMDEDEAGVKSLIGYVGGGFRYYPLTPLRKIAKATSMFYDGWDDTKYRSYIVKFGLDENKKVKELSEGMKVKFALSLALSHGAKLFILDEPTSGLDPVSREEICDILLSLVRDEGASVLFSTHVTSDLERIADDVVYISGGKVLEACPLEELRSKYAVAVFDDEESAVKAGGVGVKRVKNGYEALVPGGAQNAATATIDDIMIHLEAEKDRTTL